MKRLQHVYTMLLLFVLMPLPLFAQDSGAVFVPLSKNLPRIITEPLQHASVQPLLNALLAVSISVAAILAVVMLAIGGFKYMTTDSVFQMQGAKEQMANAIIGLLIVLTSILLLQTINPDLVSMRIFQSGV